MNRFGINLWNFIDAYSDEQADLIDHVATLGFTAVEVPVDRLDISAGLIRRKLERNGLALSVCAVMRQGRGLTSADPLVRKETGDYLKGCVALLSEVGGGVLCGPLYAGGGKAQQTDEATKSREWQFAVEGLCALADFAEPLGVTLALEPLHRYRTSLVNTVEQALTLCDYIGRRNVGIHFDSYHANIEEADILGALEAVLAKGKLLHFHACANNRGVPGAGHLPWTGFWSLLKTYGYSGMINMETFAGPGIEAVWQRPPLSPDETALAGLRYLRGTGL